MKEYLKMADVFDIPVVSLTGFTMVGTTPVLSLHGDDCNYALHAINSHDELVAMNRELLSALEACRFDSLNMTIDDLCAIRSVMAKAKGESQ